MSKKQAVAVAGWDEPRIHELVQEFVVGLEPESVRESYATGPTETYSMCFRWASSVVTGWSDLEIGLFVGEPVKSMLDVAGAWRKLTDLTFDALVAMYGPVPELRLPPTPDDLEVGFCLDVDWPEGELDRPRKKPASAEQIASYYVDSGPGLSWENNYYLSTNKSRTLWIFWWEYETEMWRPRMESYPVAYCDKKRLTRKEAGIFLLREFWKEYVRSRGVDRPSETRSNGSLSVDQISVVINEVWGEREE